MAHLVHVEPGDVLVFGHIEGTEFDTELGDRLKDALGVALVVLVPGPIDLGVVRQRLGQQDGGGT
jgi:hypothetical protein